jgi:TolB-like protein
METGQGQEAIVQLEKLVYSDPSNEEAHRELMKLYVLAGRRAEALRQFRRCAEAVRRELDADPEEGTLQLYRKILSKETRALPDAERQGIAHPAMDTIAVLPFHNDTGDPNLAYLSSGIAESLIKSLSQLAKIRVLAYSTVSRYKGRDLNPRRLGRDLMAGALATGRFVRLNGALAITAELVDTTDGSVLWGEQYQAKVTDILAMQEQIAQEISSKTQTPAHL